MENRKELDGLGLAGAILNIVMVGLEILGCLVLLIVGFVLVWNDGFGLFMIVASILVGSLAIITLIFNAKVLAGELKYKTTASVLGFICLSILGSVLLLISKTEHNNKTVIDLAEKLAKFKELYDADIITEEEFKTIKRKLVGE